MGTFQVKVIHEGLYFYKESMKPVHRVYVSIIHQDEELDGRLLPSFRLVSEKMTGVADRQIPFNFDPNKISTELIRQGDWQQITFAGKLTRRLAERFLQNYWRETALDGPLDVSVFLLQLQDYLIPSIK